MMVFDGLGPQYATLARHVKGSPLALDSAVAGLVSTSSAASAVTDSAASATAYATGRVTLNGRVGVAAQGEAAGTVLEGAKQRGMRTGVVSTAKLTHATPAAFTSHVDSRSSAYDIAEQQRLLKPDVMLGGGAQHHSRAQATQAGFAYAGNTSEMLAAIGAFKTDVLSETASAVPVLGAFTSGHMSYDLDRQRFAPNEPSIKDMTLAAIDALSASSGGSEEPFFLMVECARVDHAGHDNNALLAATDAIACDAAVEAVLERVSERDDTLFVGVADHETGGLSVGCCGGYTTNLGVLASATSSPEGVCADALALMVEVGSPLNAAVALDVALANAGIDAAAVRSTSSSDVASAEAALASSVASLNGAMDGASAAALFAGSHASMSSYYLQKAIGRAAYVGWTTGSHTASDVTLYAAGVGAEALRGRVMTNAELGTAVIGLLNVDTKAGYEMAVEAGAGTGDGRAVLDTPTTGNEQD